MAKCFKGCGVKLGAIVGDDVTWHPIPTDNVPPCEQLGRSGCYLGDWLGFHPLGEVLDGDKCEAKVALCRREGVDDVKPPPHEGPDWG